MECNSEANSRKCNCTYEPCERKGKCCECLTYHLHMAELPACAFTADVEMTYDRSFARFVKVFQAKSGKKN
jgi:hypothetical protein